MCGPSSQEEQLAGSESSFMQTLQSNYATNFAEQQNVLANLNQTLSPIVAAGPNQQGFSPSELDALNTQAIDTTGQNYKQAAVALNDETAGRNDSGNLPQSGVDQQLQEGLASSAAGQLSGEELGITQQNYATGRSNFQNAVGGEEALAGQYNPVSTGGLANNAGATAFGEENTINQQANSEEADIASAVPAGARALSAGISAVSPNADTGILDAIGSF